MSERNTAEQQARNIMERAGVEDARSMTSSDLVEIANLIVRCRALIAEVARLTPTPEEREAMARYPARQLFPQNDERVLRAFFKRVREVDHG